MGFDIRPSPARVSAAAAARFPRVALLALLATYVLSGLFGRDPWFQEDAAGFGVMWTMAHGTAADWWLPNVQGALVTEEGPLPFWIGAGLITLLGPWIGDALAARLTTLLWFLLATAGIWYATYRFARRDEAQPVAFAFGGQANSRDYGRMLADIAVLLFVGTLGLVVQMHETSAEAAAVGFAALLMFGLAVACERVLAGALIVGISLGLLALTRGPPTALLFAVGSLIALAILTPRSQRGAALALPVALLTAVTLFALWPLGSMLAPEVARREYFSAWSAWVLSAATLASVSDLRWFAERMAWYLWPLWPFALWSAYAWRQGLERVHILIPGIIVIGLLAGTILTPVAAPPLPMIAVPLAVLASFGVVSVRRAAENAIDWFAIVTFSLFGIALWAYFVAMQTGAPPRMAASVARLTPGFVPTVDLTAVALALAATLGWVALVIWRVRRRPEPLWRGPLLAAFGLAMLWVVLNALFLPALNYVRSYATLAREINDQVERAAGKNACVLTHHLLPAHRALLAYHGAVRFVASGNDCPLMLHRDSGRTALDDAPPPGDWRAVWEGRRLTRPDETMRLYRRAGR